MKRSAIRRKTPLKRTPFKPKPSRNPGFSRQVKNEVLRRSGGRCELGISPQCSGRVEHFHHIHLRSRGGANTVENCLGLDLFCHAAIHDRPALARERGWIAS